MRARCLSFHFNLRMVSMGIVTAKLEPPSLVSFLTFLFLKVGIVRRGSPQVISLRKVLRNMLGKCSFNHKQNILINILIIDFYLGVIGLPDPENFVGKRLTDCLDALKIKDYRLKFFQSA